VETPRGSGHESLYRSPDRRADGPVDRDADTGPIPQLPPSDEWDDGRWDGDRR
jgi:hypothetical protein